MSKKSPIAEVFKGIKETFSVVVLKKEPKTEFTPKTPQAAQDDEKPSGTTPTEALPAGSEIIIDGKYKEQVVDFIHNHSNIDVLEIPCLFNHRKCSAMICAFPRLIEESNSVHDVVSMILFNKDGVVAKADYGALGADAEQQFQNDMRKFGALQERPEYKEHIQNLKELFPLLDFDTPSEPAFLEDEKPKGDTI